MTDYQVAQRLSNITEQIMLMRLMREILKPGEALDRVTNRLAQLEGEYERLHEQPTKQG
jgi:hypothetical protein